MPGRRIPYAAIASLILTLTVITPVAAGSTAVTPPGPVGGRFPTVERFVDQAYTDVFGRPADPAGLAYWTGRIDAGASSAALYQELVASPEFAGTVAPIVRLYLSILDRQPDLPGLRYWVERRRQGAALEDIARSFLDGSEFAALSTARNDTEIVEAVYGRVLGRRPDAAGLAYWTERIESGSLSVPRFVVAVSESLEHRQRRHAEVVVTTVFLGLLQRLPDPAGALYWTERIRDGASLTSMIAPVIAGAEYRNRFPTAPAFSVSEAATGLTIPWDVAPLPDGRLLVSERGGRLLLVDAGTTTTVSADLSDLFASGETGLMGLALDPDIASNGRFYTCQGHASPREIQVIAWTLDAGGPSASRVQDPLVAGLPIVSGRHGGCQLEIGADGTLIVGTGDAAVGSLPQDLRSLGGKTLRVDRFSGEAPPDNPFADSPDPATRKILSYGHRNVQGIAVHPITGDVWSVEHGPSRDDEVNRIVPGANFGWHPVPGYNERVPMTDRSEFPAAIEAAWATGAPTLALSGAAFLSDPAWGSWRNGLAVASLKNQSLRVLFFTDDGQYRGQQLVLSGDHGRLRAAAVGPDGSLYLTTSNGAGRDSVLRIQPQGR
jgi:glucose/arabinose dehydrogenase